MRTLHKLCWALLLIWPLKFLGVRNTTLKLTFGLWERVFTNFCSERNYLFDFRPPYKAGNMVDLVNNIKNKPLKFPKEVNNISSLTEDVIRKMLVVDPAKRIEWDELFKHPINTYLEEKIQHDM